MDDDALLAAVPAAPDDDAVRLVYADWLDERADPRGAYLRAEAAWARPWRERRRPADDPALRALAVGLDPVWVARVSRPPMGVVLGAGLQLQDYTTEESSRPRPEPAELDALERRFDLKFPADYRALLLNENGGDVWGYRRDDHGGLLLDEHEDRLVGYRGTAQVPKSRRTVSPPVSFFTLYRDREQPLGVGRDDPTEWDNALIMGLLWLEAGRSFRNPRYDWSSEPERDLMIIGFTGPTGFYELYCLGVRGPSSGRVFNVDHRMIGDRVACVQVAPSLSELLAVLMHRPEA